MCHWDQLHLSQRGHYPAYNFESVTLGSMLCGETLAEGRFSHPTDNRLCREASSGNAISHFYFFITISDFIQCEKQTISTWVTQDTGTRDLPSPVLRGQLQKRYVNAISPLLRVTRCESYRQDLPCCLEAVTFQALTQPARSVNSMKSACMGQWSRDRVSRVVVFQSELAAALPNMPFPLAPFT